MTEKLAVQRITKDFPTKAGSVRALDSVSLSIAPGEFICIVGASGCGKSTLLEIIAGFTEPTTGKVLLDGREILGPGPDRGLVFQRYSLYPWRTVAQNVSFGLEVANLPRNAIKERVDYYLGVMNLTKWANALPSQLSGGMRQRVAIARSLATEPEVLLLDEPLGSLDAQTKFLMQDFLRDVWKRTNTTVLMVTHDVEEALYLSQRIYAFSSHPGRVKRELRVPFGEQRNREVRRDTQFLDLRDEVQSLLIAEVVEA